MGKAIALIEFPGPKMTAVNFGYHLGTTYICHCSQMVKSVLHSHSKMKESPLVKVKFCSLAKQKMLKNINEVLVYLHEETQSVY